MLLYLQNEAEEKEKKKQSHWIKYTTTTKISKTSTNWNAESGATYCVCTIEFESKWMLKRQLQTKTRSRKITHWIVANRQVEFGMYLHVCRALQRYTPRFLFYMLKYPPEGECGAIKTNKHVKQRKSSIDLSPLHVLIMEPSSLVVIAGTFHTSSHG